MSFSRRLKLLDNFDITGSAKFVGEDRLTQGNWTDKYGKTASYLVNGPKNGNVFSFGKSATTTWTRKTQEARALFVPGDTARLAAAAYYKFPFDITVNVTGSYRLTAYFLVWDKSDRTQSVTLIHPATGKVLDGTVVSNFGDGVYVSWDVIGPVVMRIAPPAGVSYNVMVSALFIDPAPVPEEETDPVKRTQPAVAFVDGFVSIVASHNGSQVTAVKEEGKLVLTTPEGWRAEYPLAEVLSVGFRGGPGNDLFDGRNLTVPVHAVTGGGSDTLIGGSGQDTLLAGMGDDTIVAAPGDVVWAGPEDKVLGIDEKDVVRFDTFQNGPDRSFDGDRTNDPVGLAHTRAAALPLFKKGGPYGYKHKQGRIGNCWLMAALAKIGEEAPVLVRKCVVSFRDGTYGVRLYNQYQKVWNFYRVDNDTPQGNVTGREELWAEVVSKVYAFYRSSLFKLEPSYKYLNGGWGREVYQAFGFQGGWGNGMTPLKTADDLLKYIRDMIAAKKLLSVGILGTGKSGLVGSHMYAVRGVTLDRLKKPMVHLWNPWGFDSKVYPDKFMTAQYFFNYGDKHVDGFQTVTVTAE